MKTTIPARVEYTCDRCLIRLGEGDIGASGSVVNFVARDFSGAAVGSETKNFDLCASCSMALRKWFLPDKEKTS